MRARAKKEVTQDPVAGKWDLPAGWEWKRLGEVATATAGSCFPEYLQGKTQGAYPFAKVKDISRCFRSGSKFISSADNFIDQHEIDIIKPKIFPIGSIVFAKIGEALKCNYRLITKNEMCFDNNVMGIVSECVHRKFLYYYLTTQDFGELSVATTVPSVRKADIDCITIPLPPSVQDQERIVERIDSLFAELDKAEETLRHTITLCEQYKQSVLKAAVTGELSKEWRKANPPKETGEQLLQRILKERRAAWEKAELAKMTAKGQKPVNDSWKKKYKEPQVPDTSNLQELPEGWTWASMDMLGAWSGGGTPSKAVADFWEGSIPWVSSKDVKQYYIEDTELHISSVAVTESATNIIQKNSVVMVMRSGVLKHTFPVSIIKVDAAINQDIKSITLVLSVNEHYLMTFLYAHNKKILASCAKDGTTVQSVEYTQLQKYPVPIPPVLEQEHIVKCAQIVIEETEGIIKMCHAQVTQTTALRQSILKQAFTGKLA